MSSNGFGPEWHPVRKEKKVYNFDHDEYLLSQCEHALSRCVALGYTHISLSGFFTLLLEMGKPSEYAFPSEVIRDYTVAFADDHPKYKEEYASRQIVGKPSINPTEIFKRTIASLAILQTAKRINLLDQVYENELPDLIIRVLPEASQHAWAPAHRSFEDTDEYYPIVDTLPDEKLDELTLLGEPNPQLSLDDTQPNPPLR
jgi:hypothetical protein